MSNIIQSDEGYDKKSHPFVTVYEKLIDGQIFRYAEYKGEAYLAIKDAAVQIKHYNPISSTSKFHERYKLLLPNSFKKFKVFTSGGPQEILFANINAINIFCSRAKNREVAVKYISKLTQFQKWFYSTRTALTFNEEQAFVIDKLKGDVKFQSSEIKFLHEKNSESRRALGDLALAVKQLQNQLDVKINSDQVDEIYDLVQKQLAFAVAEHEGLENPNSTIYRRCWTNFNKKFNISTYRNLPSSEFKNAKEFLSYEIERVSKGLE